VSKEKKTEEEEEEKWSLTALNQGHFRKPLTPHALLLSCDIDSSFGDGNHRESSR